MNWMFPKNDDSCGLKVVIIPHDTKDGESRRDVQAVELYIGNEDDMLQDCQRLVMTRKEWKELRKIINDLL